MTRPGDHLPEFEESANLPASDPSRDELIRRIAELPEAERDQWAAFLAETDRLYARMAEVAVPPELVGNLLNIPSAISPPSSRSRMQRPLGWKTLGVILLSLATAAIAIFVATRPVHRSPLDARLSERIGEMAVKNADNRPEVTSGDARQVREVLENLHSAVSVSIPNPPPGMQLLGGGVADFNGEKAVFTRWRGKDGLYTLYQFDGTRMGVPPQFKGNSLYPTGDKAHRRVDIWLGAGGQDDWALVLEGTARNDFTDLCR